MKGEADAYLRSAPVKYMHGLKNNNSTGEYIKNTNDSAECYQGSDLDNVRYSQVISVDVKDCYDYSSWGINANLVYETTQTGSGISNIKFCTQCIGLSSNMEYCANTWSSHNMFGCVGLRNKEYCILNKQYTKDAFETLRAQIIEDMNDNPYIDSREKVYRYGEFFPPEFSPFCYADSTAQDYLPMTQEDVEKEGYNTGTDVPENIHQPTLGSEDIPDHINDVDNSILKEILACSGCTKAFKLIEKELSFYRKYQIPVPRKCQDCRYLDRIRDRNPMEWTERQCMCAGTHSDGEVYENNNGGHKDHESGKHCPNTFMTSYPSESPAIVYCESCYNDEVL